MMDDTHMHWKPYVVALAIMAGLLFISYVLRGVL